MSESVSEQNRVQKRRQRCTGGSLPSIFTKPATNATFLLHVIRPVSCPLLSLLLAGLQHFWTFLIPTLAYYDTAVYKFHESVFDRDNSTVHYVRVKYIHDV